jgi:hypothetical protein
LKQLSALFDPAAAFEGGPTLADQRPPVAVPQQLERTHERERLQGRDTVK